MRIDKMVFHLYFCVLTPVTFPSRLVTLEQPAWQALKYVLPSSPHTGPNLSGRHSQFEHAGINCPVARSRPAKSSMGQPMDMRTPMPTAYTTAVNAIQAATQRAFGLTRRMKTPLMMMPRPITRIPPTPAQNTRRSLKRKFLQPSFQLQCVPNVKR